MRVSIVAMMVAALLVACSGAASPTSPPPVATTATAAPATAARTTAGSVRYVVVADTSQATYAVSETFVSGARLATARGTTGIAGALVLDGSGKVVADGSLLTADLRLLKSDDSRRDSRLQTQWLESNSYPLAEFRPTGLTGTLVEGQEVALKLNGTMKIRSTEQPLTFDLKALLKDGTVTGTGTTSFKMSSFGVQPPDIAGMLKAEDDVSLDIIFTATRAS